jgi:hypothetical protein
MLVLGAADLWAQTWFSDGSMTVEIMPGMTNYVGPRGETGLLTELMPGVTQYSFTDIEGRVTTGQATTIVPGPSGTRQGSSVARDRSALRGSGRTAPGSSILDPYRPFWEGGQ